MRLRRIAGILIVMTAAAAPAPGPSAEAVARRLMDSAVALEQAGRHHEAIEQLSDAIASEALSPADTARALFDRGVAYDGLGNWRAAMADYGAALRLDGGLAPVLINRGSAYRRAGRWQQARRDYWAALKCPGVAREVPYYGLGLIAEREGDADAARAWFQKALAANPDFAPAAQRLVVLAGAPPAPLALRPAVDSPATVQVQMGAFRSEAAAAAAWNLIAADARKGLTPIIRSVDLPGKGRLWRLRTAVSSRQAARALCRAVSRQGLACMLVR